MISPLYLTWLTPLPQISDGAAAVLLARRSVAKKLGLPILGKFCAAAVAGVPPKLMGIGPAFAIPKVLAKVGLTTNDVDLWEINEAFASQAVMSIETLKIPYEKVNPVGGAIGEHFLSVRKIARADGSRSQRSDTPSERLEPGRSRPLLPSASATDRRSLPRPCASVPGASFGSPPPLLSIPLTLPLPRSMGMAAVFVNEQ